MGFFLNFEFPKTFLISIFHFSSYGTRYIISKELKPIFDDPFINIFLMYIGEAFSGFVYFYQKYFILKQKEPKTNDKSIYLKTSSKYNLLIHFLIFMCTFCDYFGFFEFEYFYTYKMKKFIHYISFLNGIILSFFIIINEHFILKIQLFRHHYLGLILMFITLPIFIIYLFIIKQNSNFSYFLLILIIFRIKNN